MERGYFLSLRSMTHFLPELALEQHYFVHRVALERDYFPLKSMKIISEHTINHIFPCWRTELVMLSICHGCKSLVVLSQSEEWPSTPNKILNM